MTTEKQNDIFGHQPGLFLLFFTEMWERFSYYGMRALLVLFLVGQIADGGWNWLRADAMKLYGVYTFLVYLTPILGGLIADKLLGYRLAVTLGAFLMTLGHASMAAETEAAFYTGLGLLIVGNGFFKPNISSMVGQLYKDQPDKKDGAYTIFYMGINAGAFLGILLCGYLGEKVAWSYGFGLAGIFMGLGMVMFHLGGPLLGEIGKRPTPENKKNAETIEDDTPEHVVRDRLFVIGILSFFTIFFWMAFEQAGGSMSIFALDYTDRMLEGTAANAFFWINTALTVGPLLIVTYVLFRLIKATYKIIPLSNFFIATSFVIIWGIALWMLSKEYNMKAYAVSFDVPVAVEAPAEGEANAAATPEPGVAETAPTDASSAEEVVPPTKLERIETKIHSDQPLVEGQTIYLIDRDQKEGKGKLKLIAEADVPKFEKSFVGKIDKVMSSETEVQASWFQILNSFFIISLAPLFNRIWGSKYNPSAPVKFGAGLILLGIGFGVLALSCTGLDKEAKTASISMWWLIFAFLFHTLGELCVSPVGLSYVSKLAPLRLVGLMFGIWFCASAIANLLAGWSGSMIDSISEEYGLSGFFLIFTVIPVASGLLMWVLTPTLKKMMHGIH